jgi:electron transfer flavoprotein beta subunit
VRVLVCIKRVPATGGDMAVTADGQEIDTSFVSFTISPHEECGIEEAIRIVAQHGGSSTALTLGPAAAEEQLREAIAVGIDRAILLETDGREYDAVATAAAITAAIQAEEAANGPFEIMLFGNESADTGGFQVGIRVAIAFGRPVVTGVKSLSTTDGSATALREAPDGGWERYEIPLPAVIGVKEGLNLPRYPSLPGRLRARNAVVERVTPAWTRSGHVKVGLRVPEQQRGQRELLGTGPDAAPAIVDLLEQVGAVRR